MSGQSKKPRGRPKGSGIRDGRHLDRVADLMVKEPTMKATAAMRKVVREGHVTGASPAAAVRRLQRKWKEDPNRRLEAARERQEEKREGAVVRIDAFAHLGAQMSATAEAWRAAVANSGLAEIGSRLSNMTATMQLAETMEQINRHNQMLHEALNPPGLQAAFAALESERVLRDLALDISLGRLR